MQGAGGGDSVRVGFARVREGAVTVGARVGERRMGQEQQHASKTR